MGAEHAAPSLGTALAIDGADRPVGALPTRTLVRLSVYWLGIMALWAGLSSVLAGRLQFEGLVPAGTEGTALFHMMAIGGFLAIVVQPAVGAISDHSVSRWGRRKPYIIIGSLADLVFLAGIASSNTVVAIAACIVALQVSSNIAQGPYQGYVPDLVPPRQVGLASGLIGLMLILGNVVGFIVGAVAIATGAYVAATIGLGVLETATMAILVTGVREGGTAAPRDGRSWRQIAFGAWGRDLLGERDFLWFLGSRLLVLTGGSTLTNLAPFYLARSFGLKSRDAGTLMIGLVGVVALGTLVSVVPAARLSDRRGRKRVIVGSCLLGAIGLAICAGAPAIPVAFAGTALFGVSSGAFLAVDWALLSELVPRVTSGRFMGISNVATGSAGLLAVTLGGTVMDLVGGPGRDASGPRAALTVGAACFAAGAVLLRPVREPGRE